MENSKKSSFFDYAPESISNLQKGIDSQREIFKQANLENEYEVMVKCIENIKSEIKNRIIAIGNSKEVVDVEQIIMWYKTLHIRYSKRTEQGYTVDYPVDINFKVGRALNMAYEKMIEQLNVLNLI